jgi:hypothetical protein
MNFKEAAILSVVFILLMFCLEVPAMAEVLVSKRLFEEILERIHQLKPVPIGYG